MPAIIVPSINWMLDINITTFHILSFIYFFYFILGQYVVRYPIKKSYAIIALLLSVSVLTLLEFFTEHHLTGSKYGSIPIAIIATTIFSLFSNLRIKPNKIVNAISKDSFAIYIIHVFWIHVMEMVLNIQLKNTVPVFGEIAIYIYRFLPHRLLVPKYYVGCQG